MDFVLGGLAVVGLVVLISFLKNRFDRSGQLKTFTK